jgi:PilZ domain
MYVVYIRAQGHDMLRRGYEARKHARRPFRYNGWLRTETCSQPIGCVLFDVSSSGARLTASAPHGELPDRFLLILAAAKIQRRCEIVWRNECYVGVRFLG